MDVLQAPLGRFVGTARRLAKTALRPMRDAQRPPREAASAPGSLKVRVAMLMHLRASIGQRCEASRKLTMPASLPQLPRT